MRSSTEAVDPYYDAGDRASVKDKEKHAKNRELMLVSTLKELMGTKSGRLWIFSVLATAGFYKSAFNGNSRDYHDLGAWNASFGIFMSIHQHCLKDYVLMIEENLHV